MKIHLKPIHDQVIVLIGATSGIGLETAKHLAEKGARVVIVGRSQEGLSDALDKVRSHIENHHVLRMGSPDYYMRPGSFVSSQAAMTGGAGLTGGAGMTGGGEAPYGAPVSEMTAQVSDAQVMTLEGDITDFEQMRSVAEQVVQRFGRIDTWVNVAAVGEWALFEDTSPDEFKRIIDVNLVGHANAAMAALPYLRQQNGSALIFVSSVGGRVPIPYQAAYTASKHGLNGLVDTLRMELKHSGTPVSVTNIMPTSINTPLFEKARTKIGVEPDPLPPIYDTTLAAKAIAYAAAHPVKELMVGDAGILMNFLKRLSPGLAHGYISKTAFRSQRSDEPKSAQAPDNLYGHIEGYNRAEGEYSEMRLAPMTWLSTHPKAKLAIFGGLLAIAGGVVGWRLVQKQRRYHRSLGYRVPRAMRMIAKQTGKGAISARKSLDKAGKSANKALHSAGRSIAHMPGVSNLPMFHKRSLGERVVDSLTGFWAGALAILPFTRSKKLTRRITDRLQHLNLPAIDTPWKRRKTFAERITLADQRKAVGKKIGKTTEQVRDQIHDGRKEAAKMIDKAAQGGKRMIRKTPMMGRRESLVDKVISKN